MKRSTALLAGILAVVAVLALSGYFGIGLNQVSYVTLVYDSGSGIFPQGIVVAANGTTTDLTMTPARYAAGQIEKINCIPHMVVSTTIFNAVPTDQIKLVFTASWGSATYGGSSISTTVMDSNTYTYTTTGNSLTNGTAFTITADGVSNLWARHYVRCIDLVGTTYQLAPAAGQSKTLSLPVTLSVQLYINGAASGAPQTVNLIGTATVTNNPTTGAITVTTATITTNYVALSVFAH